MAAPSPHRATSLAGKFRQQEAFSQGYAPLYARLFGTVAGWLEAEEALADPVVSWLLPASAARTPLEVTLLLAAGLHRAVLGGEPAVAELAAFYPTVGGPRAAHDRAFPAVLRQAILGQQPRLARFMERAQVQTNETGRGLAWLLPLHLTGWRAAHLVDLGASAGLNLLADRRHYRLVDAGSGAPLLQLGDGRPPQFTVRCTGPVIPPWAGALQPLPAILSRLGGDLRPFPLRHREDELDLLCFVWGDHPERLERLREGLAARRRAGAQVQLAPLQMPQEVEAFLAAHVPASPHPVVIYNTYMTTYLPDKGQSLRRRIGRWAAAQPRPVLWLQWEPPGDGSAPPAPYWCLWSADLWQDGRQEQWALGWVHPHGQAARFHHDFVEWGPF